MTVSLAIASRIAVAALLVVAAGAKLADRRGAGHGMRALGAPRRAAGASAVATAALELGLAAGLAAGLRAASYAAAAFFAAGAIAITRAMALGRAGRPCGCFGVRSRIGARALVRALALSALAGAGPWLPTVHPGTQALLAAGLIVALVGVVALGVAVLALAREVGELRLRVGPQAALELLGEGPELGSRTSVVERFEPAADARYAVAVFTSASCPVCSALEPALDLMAHDPMLRLRVFDEVRDADAWQELQVPGSPYAAVLDLDGRVLSKGTFNTLGQLESLLATAHERALEPALA